MTNNNWRAYLGEFVGTFGFILIGAGAVVSAEGGGGFGLLGIALAHGLGLAAMVYGVARFSGGHLNPAVTVAMWLARKVTAAKATAYIVAQLLGSVLAAYVLKLVLPLTASASKIGLPMLASDITPTAAVLAEAVFTFFLVWVVIAGSAEGAGIHHSSMAAGFVVAAGILVVGPFTGGAFNPARAFGPAFVAEYWVNHSVWWIGPLIGGAAAALMQRFISPSKGE